MIVPKEDVLFRNMNAAMIYAERTGHDQFEESDEMVPELTPEEKEGILLY